MTRTVPAMPPLPCCRVSILPQLTSSPTTTSSIRNPLALAFNIAVLNFETSPWEQQSVNFHPRTFFELLQKKPEPCEPAYNIVHNNDQNSFPVVYFQQSRFNLRRFWTLEDFSRHRRSEQASANETGKRRLMATATARDDRDLRWVFHVEINDFVLDVYG